MIKGQRVNLIGSVYGIAIEDASEKGSLERMWKFQVEGETEPSVWHDKLNHWGRVHFWPILNGNGNIVSGTLYERGGSPCGRIGPYQKKEFVLAAGHVALDPDGNVLEPWPTRKYLEHLAEVLRIKQERQQKRQQAEQDADQRVLSEMERLRNGQR